MKGWIDVGQVRVVDDPEDDWHGWKFVIESIYWPDAGEPKPSYRLLRIDGEVSPACGDYWLRHFTRPL